MSKLVEFNANDYVWVRLTDDGRARLRKSHEELYHNLGYNPPFDYAPPAEDRDGWSRWQLWDLMSKLGPYTYQCGPYLFEMTFRFDLDDFHELTTNRKPNKRASTRRDSRSARVQGRKH